jgi:hypothetical protein
MKILQIQDNRLEALLSPIASLLDGYWWWIGGAGAMPGDLLAASFWIIQEQRFNWFVAFKNVPPDIALITRVIDGGYWDLFFRDDWLFEVVEQPLRNGSLTPGTWRAFADEREFDRHMAAVAGAKDETSRPLGSNDL